MMQDAQLSVAELIEGLSKEQLTEFLVDYAERDSKIVNALNVRFGIPEFKTELAKIQRKINDALKGVSDWSRHDSWGHVYIDTNDIFNEIHERAEQGHVKLAFAQLEMLYRKLLAHFEYQGECEISDDAEYCLTIMFELADKAILEEDKEYIFKRCIELTEFEDGKDYGADYEDRLLSISAKFVTLENVSQLDAALTRYESRTWEAEKFKLIRLEIIRKTEGDESTDRFIAENLTFPKIREIAYDKAVIAKDFEQGEHLCIEALATYEHRYGISPWLYKLYNIYELMGSLSKMTETAKKILLSGDLKYYDTLKSLLEKQAVWDNAYPQLLGECSANLSYSGYMEILEKEKEYDLLLEQTEMHMEQVYCYGKLLAGKYPSEVCSIFTSQLDKEASTANSRKSYSTVCSHIKLFAEAGYVEESQKLIESFKTKFKRKPAFVDELKKTAM